MKVFMSWSGRRSHEVAKMFHQWIKCVIQATEPWLSSDAIESGSVWFSTINEELRDTSTGIICLTQENKNKPWILFEAGALAKGLSDSRVCTFLIDLQPHDLQDPLAQFNATLPNKTAIKKLVANINARVEPKPLSASIFEQVFETYWPQFEREFNTILAATMPEVEPEPRPKEDILNEILNATRSLTRRINNLESGSNILSSSPDLKREVPRQTRMERVERRDRIRKLLQNSENASRLFLLHNSVASGMPYDELSIAMKDLGISSDDLTHFINDPEYYGLTIIEGPA
jgi:hypothetical protein